LNTSWTAAGEIPIWGYLRRVSNSGQIIWAKDRLLVSLAASRPALVALFQSIYFVDPALRRRAETLVTAIFPPANVASVRRNPLPTK
jgi:hypothetical protein